MKVLKFGGTSVGSVESILSLKQIVEREAKKQPCIVVVSALGGITDKLLETSRLALAGDERYRKTKPWPLCRDHQCLEHDLQDEERQSDEENVSVHHAVADHGFVRSQKSGDIV